MGGPGHAVPLVSLLLPTPHPSAAQGQESTARDLDTMANEGAEEQPGGGRGYRRLAGRLHHLLGWEDQRWGQLGGGAGG